MIAKFVVAFIFIAIYQLCECLLYTDFALYSVTPTELYQLKFLQNLEKNNLNFRFWKKPHRLYDEVQLIISPKDKEYFLERAQHFKMNLKLEIDSVQRAFDSQEIKKYLRLQVESYKWDSYHSLDDINQWLSDMALKYPSLIELEIIGKSVEGRDIYAVAIKRPSAKASVIIEGGIHGNEWISVEVVTYIIHQLTNEDTVKSFSAHYGNVVDLYNWYLIPLVNPDGYEYSMKQDRLWRKNRRHVGGDFGVDLNRNFNYSFGNYGSSKSPMDDDFCGPSPFSEPETRAYAEYVVKRRSKLTYFFAFHSYGLSLIVPYADRVNHVENFKEMENYGKQAILKMYKLNGVKYSIGTTYDILGLRISGNSASWVKKNFKVKYVFTFLLRDNGTYGYALPSNQILPTCDEAMTGLLEIMTARLRRMGSHMYTASSVCGTASVSFLILLSTLTFYV